MRTSAPCRDLPAEFGSWTSVFRQVRRWNASGLGRDAAGFGRWQRRRRPPANDRQHQHAGAPPRRRRKGGAPNRQGLGRSRGGRASKLHLRAQAHGLPIAQHPSAGQKADFPNDETLTAARGSDPVLMLADTRYDSDPLRQHLPDRRTVQEVLTKGNCASSTASAARSLVAQRHRVLHPRRKDSRRVATRYDQTTNSVLALATLASIRPWSRAGHAACLRRLSGSIASDFDPPKIGSAEERNQVLSPLVV